MSDAESRKRCSIFALCSIHVMSYTSISDLAARGPKVNGCGAPPAVKNGKWGIQKKPRGLRKLQIGFMNMNVCRYKEHESLFFGILMEINFMSTKKHTNRNILVLYMKHFLYITYLILKSLTFSGISF